VQRIRRMRPTPTPEPEARVRRTRPVFNKLMGRYEVPDPKNAALSIAAPPLKTYYFKLGTRFVKDEGEYEIVGFGPGVVQVKCLKICGMVSQNQPRSWIQDIIVAEILGM
jgi:hypothetical protein